MPIVTVTNLTSRKLPVSTYIGVLDALAYRSVDLSVEYYELASAKLIAMETAGLISFTVALEIGADTKAFSPNSIKGSVYSSGAGCPNGVVYAPQGAVYTNTNNGNATATAGSGAFTTIAAGLLNPAPSPAVDYFTVTDGNNHYIFQFTDATHALVMAGALPVLVSGLTADQVRDAIIVAINLTDLRITASSGGAATVTLTQDDRGIIVGSSITENVTNAGFIVTPLTAVDSTFWVHVILSTILSSTNASPIEVTTAALNGLATGDRVTITGHTTNTSANGTWTITYVSPTKFTLNTSVGVGIGGATGTLTCNDAVGTRWGWIGK